MKAAIYHGPPGSWPEKPMTIEEVPRPTPGPKDVLVKVVACGLCRTDLTYLHGGPTPKEPPIILGHEPSGIVTEVGAEAGLTFDDEHGELSDGRVELEILGSTNYSKAIELKQYLDQVPNLRVLSIGGTAGGTRIIVWAIEAIPLGQILRGISPVKQVVGEGGGFQITLKSSQE